jgi:hypothetical protein
MCSGAMSCCRRRPRQEQDGAGVLPLTEDGRAECCKARNGSKYPKSYKGRAGVAIWK